MTLLQHREIISHFFLSITMHVDRILPFFAH